MLRWILCGVIALATANAGAGQTFRSRIISAEKNLNAEDGTSHGRDITPDCAIAWSVAVKTLHGGKQEGVRLITLDNGKLRIVLVPTRGMGILSVALTPDPSPRGRGEKLKLGWKSPVTEVVHPKHVNLNLRGGLGWLEGFNEWLARCGLENTGQAGKDEIINNVGDKQTVDLTLHGKIANIPASEVEILVEKKAPHRITVRGAVYEKMLFGPKLELITEVSTEPGSNQFRIEDTVTNKGSQPQEFQILYHYNFGAPLLGDGAKLHVPVERVTPYNANAARDVKTWNTFAGPKSGYVEQVYLMRPLADKHGSVNVLLHNPRGDRCVVLHYAKKQLPYLTLWKNTGHEDDGYVIGIEPGVSFPNARKVERAAGRVPRLAGGASHSMRMDFTLHSEKADVDASIQAIDAVQRAKTPSIRTKPVAP
ncbi:MAG: aldose 1-epimerase family protein [Planctomycetes bacterium]|nr:aldose 1-epimerase family protein [Planctomycetota bacterium]